MTLAAAVHYQLIFAFLTTLIVWLFIIHVMGAIERYELAKEPKFQDGSHMNPTQM
jgi:thiosulfate reductase cytochrome b subunit